MTLGTRLRRLRRGFNFTLEEMSDRCGIPVSTLSKVEHDRLSLTYDRLKMLSKGLEVPLSHLFEDESDLEPKARVTGRRSVGKSAGPLRVIRADCAIRFLCTELNPRRMVPLLTELRGAPANASSDLKGHSGEKLIFVVHGEVEVKTEYYEPITLARWQSLYLDASMGHGYCLPKDTAEATLLEICSSDDADLQDKLLRLHDAETSAR